MRRGLCSLASAAGRVRPGRPGKAQTAFGDSFYENPVRELESFVEEPLLLEDERWFEPSQRDMEAAERLFGRDVRREARAAVPKDCPNLRLPEIAMMGYSNVGKSSLIKALFHRSPRLKVETSRRPGHTKTVDFFRVGQSLALVDMPGYGLNQPDSFATTVGAYLTRRQNLRCAFLLFNGEQGISNEDVFIVKKLERLQIEYAIVMTKIDKFSRSQKLRTLLELRRMRDTFARDFCHSQPFLVSSHTGQGLGFLQAYIAGLAQGPAQQ